jgi:gluconokinase
MSAPLVLGVDIGTTSTKVVAFDPRGTAVATAGLGYPLDEPSPGFAVQAPEVVAEAVRGCVREVVAKVGAERVAGLSFSAAMHGLVGLDGDREPLTPLITWADTRARAQAERLRAQAGGLALHRRTGTPLHPMSPLPKLVWFAEQEPALHQRARHWIGVKEYVVLQLCGELVIDHSMASGTGLMDLSSLQWDDEALEAAGLAPDRLPPLVATRTVLPRLLPQVAADLGLGADVPVVVGAGDGPLANLGLGAVGPGVAACSIGTSGALRVMVDEPAVDELGQVFCYALTEDRWVVGGAINNGGVVLDWVGDALAPDLGDGAEVELLELASRAPVGSGGLVVLPYLLSERAPHWSAVPQGAYVGLSRGHRREHLVRAALEGVGQQLALVLASMRSAGLVVDEVRATGGFTRSAVVRQLLADVLGLPVAVPAGHEGSSLGAALLGMEALGIIESIDAAADLVHLEEQVGPDPAAAATYADLLQVHGQIYDALLPAFSSLRRLAPGLPLER